ncbi:hypothetical protein TrLO_g7105 [Triparma laevis f. longispina]|uniref:Uncharacterized protein n=1 Tax=Triparma laevis f. longispina TaxID=1714387 RepID=A0A9W6ZZV7_9STRA|nr:hypothetical protein TrLO_g7105 [Triparma laevis f. longispina]
MREEEEGDDDVAGEVSEIEIDGEGEGGVTVGWSSEGDVTVINCKFLEYVDRVPPKGYAPQSFQTALDNSKKKSEYLRSYTR